VVGDLGSRRPRPAPCLPQQAVRARRYEASARSRRSRLAVADDVAAAYYGPRNPLNSATTAAAMARAIARGFLGVLPHDAQQLALRARGSLFTGNGPSASASGLPEISSAIAPPPSDRGVVWPSCNAVRLTALGGMPATPPAAVRQASALFDQKLRTLARCCWLLQSERVCAGARGLWSRASWASPTPFCGNSQFSQPTIRPTPRGPAPLNAMH
jgi:hypothetical protein